MLIIHITTDITQKTLWAMSHFASTQLLGHMSYNNNTICSILNPVKMIICCKGGIVSSQQTNFRPNVSPKYSLLAWLWEQFGTNSQQTGHICITSAISVCTPFPVSS